MIAKNVEDILKSINRVSAKKNIECSTDIYYNDCTEQGEQFVCKIKIFQGTHTEFYHFRNKCLQDSLLDAYNFINSI